MSLNIIVPVTGKGGAVENHQLYFLILNYGHDFINQTL